MTHATDSFEAEVSLRSTLRTVERDVSGLLADVALRRWSSARARREPARAGTGGAA